jgi:hypothetical protein
MIFGKNVFDMGSEFWFSLQLLSKTLLIWRRIQWDIIYWLQSSHNLPVIFDFNDNLKISWQILAEPPITKFHEILKEAKLLHADRHDKANTTFLRLYECTWKTQPKGKIPQRRTHTYVG